MLTVKRRKELFRYLGLGEYNKANILKFQKKYFVRKKDQDGIYGRNTETLLKHVFYVKRYSKNFKPEEFKCECGGRYCTGYPTYMKPAVLVNIQKIRNKYGKPVHVTSGLRCKGLNSRLVGSSSTSRHLSGLAIDFYISGIMNALSRRKSLINFARKLANHHYSYCHGYSSGGYSVSAPNMGSAIHTDAINRVVKAVSVTAGREKKTKGELASDWAIKTAKSGLYRYKKWNSKDRKTKICPICNKLTGKYKGFNCIGFVAACYWHGASVRTHKCSMSGFGDNRFFDTLTEARWKARNGSKWKEIKNTKASNLKKGDVLICYKKSNHKKYIHFAIYVGNGKYADSTSGRTPNVGIRNYSSLASRYYIRVFRYGE